MKTRRSPRRASLLAAAAIALALSSTSQAAVKNYLGTGEGEDPANYNAATNWDPTGVPNTAGGDVANIGAGVTANYTPGGDLIISNGGSINVNGGSFSQIVGNAWFKIGNGAGTTGSVNVTAGSFNAGTSSNFWVGFGGANGVLNVSGGTFSASNTFTVTSLGIANISGGVVTLSGGNNMEGTMNLSGNSVTTISGDVADDNAYNVYGNATLNFLGEIKSLANLNVYGGLVTTTLLAPQGATLSTLNLHGGRIQSSGTYDGGIHAPNGSYVNFTGGAAELYLSNISNVEPLFSSGRIRLNDAITTSSAFNISSLGSGTLISLVPEPSTGLATLIGLGGLLIARRRRA